MKSGNAVWIERRSVRKGRVNKLIAASLNFHGTPFT